MQVGDYAVNNGFRSWLQPCNGAPNGHSMQLKQEIVPSIGEFGSTSISQFHPESNGSSKAAKIDNCKTDNDMRDMYESFSQTNLSMTLGAPIGNSNPLRNDVLDEREQSKTSSSILLGPRSRHLLPKPPRSTLTTGLEANAGMMSQIRVARPPAEGRGRNQLLPRYWPRITDQELRQISGEYPLYWIIIGIFYYWLDILCSMIHIIIVILMITLYFGREKSFSLTIVHDMFKFKFHHCSTF